MNGPVPAPTRLLTVNSASTGPPANVQPDDGDIDAERGRCRQRCRGDRQCGGRQVAAGSVAVGRLR